MTLNNLNVGHTATVTKINSTNSERRRLLDLGILPGTKIENVMLSPLGDPVAYLIRSSVIALRNDQTKLIEIEETIPSE